MAIVVTCPACGKKGKIPDNFQGSDIKCPACNTRFGVEVRTTLTMNAIKTDKPSDLTNASEDQKSDPVRPRWSKRRIWIAFAGAVACVIFWISIQDWLYPNYVGIGYHARNRGDLVEAERNYKLAVGQGGTDEHMAVSLGGLGRTYLDLGRNQEAEEILGKSAKFYVELAKKNPDSVWVGMACDAMEDLGMSQIKQDKSLEGIKNYLSGLELEQKEKGYLTGVEKPLFAAQKLRKTGQYPKALHWIEQAQYNAISLKSLNDPKFRFDEIWPECLKELVSIYRESGMIQDEGIAAKVMGIERNIRAYDEQARGKNSRGQSTARKAAYTVLSYEADNTSQWFKVEIPRKISVQELRSLAVAIKAEREDKRPHTSIFFSFPGRDNPEAAWALVEFEPDLNLRMLGTTIEEEKFMLAQPLPAHTELIGVWFYDADEPSRYTMYRTAQGVFLSTMGKEGGEGRVDEMVEKPTIRGRRRFQRKDEPAPTWYYLVHEDGRFEYRDVGGSEWSVSVKSE